MILKPFWRKLTAVWLKSCKPFSQHVNKTGFIPLARRPFRFRAQSKPFPSPATAEACVCNDLFYRLLHQYRGTGVLVDFIHVPFLPEQAKNGEPSMALADMARALEALILALEP